MYDYLDDPRLEEKGSIFEKYEGLNRDVKRIDAAFVWVPNGRTYLFSGPDYYRYDESRRVIDYGYPRNIHDAWNGVPGYVDSVFIWSNGVTYFFKGTDDFILTMP